MFMNNSHKKNSSHKIPEDSNTSVYSAQNILSSKMIADVPSGQSLAMERWLLQGLLKVMGQPPIRFELWDGSVIDSASATNSGPATNPESTKPQFTLRLMDRRAVYQLLANPSLHFGDLYSAGRLHIDGDLLALLQVLYGELYRMNAKGSTLLKTLWRDQAPRSSSMHNAKESIHHHYDLCNAFYSLWLDQQAMQYTCAYYADTNMTLEQAQQAKMEHICRKLMLKPGMRVVEAGSGWGGLSRYMAEHYEVYVTSYNISPAQVEYSKKQAALQGLSDRIHYIEDDYRNIEGQFDVFVSVGMLEHVGKQNYSTMAKVINRCLAPEGVGLIHSIGRNQPGPINGWIERRIFPGSYPPSVGEFMNLFEQGPFSVLDVENLRLHYASTLDHWLQRFEQHREQVAKLYDESFVRAWRLYLTGSIAGFTTGSLQLFQVVFARDSCNAIPRHRQYLYQDMPAPSLFIEREK